ncbi:MAG: hypothetical protein PWP28_252 [Oceanotoga sp.]|uniref:glycosyltransferase n=1 Tax=Oceanotoga sp. TaxID=2108366 RepID=UPI0026544701|nr:glycosyltransferase [Oceanotoga sp.]MDN5341377.1 hypothetical protein [Oceanotoga sp.]
MENKKVAVVSLKFSPGHISHLIAFYKLFFSLYSEVFLLLDEKYKKYLKDENIENIIYYSTDKDIYNYDIYLFQNPSILNHKFANKINKNSYIIYNFHEPWDGIKKYLKESFKNSLKMYGAHYYNKKMLKASNKILVPSQYALKMYKKYDFKYNNNVSFFPLIFDDECGINKIKNTKKEYFSFIGTATKNRNISKFIDFCTYANKKNSNLKFLIYSRRKVDDYNINKIQNLINKGIVKVKHGKPLTNEEINEGYLKSYAVWNNYSRSTQSGVLAKAMMFGTASLASNIGSFKEFINNNYNGFVLERGTNEEILKKIDLIIEDNNIKTNCRNYFMDNFYYKNQINLMKGLISKNA